MVAAALTSSVIGASERIAEASRASRPDDPYVEVVKLALDPPGSDSFGYGISVDGNRALIGAEGEHGTGRGRRIYVYERRPEFPADWRLVATLDPPDADYIGRSVSLLGNLAAASGSRFDGKRSIWLFEKDEGGPNAWGVIGRLDKPDPDGGVWGGLSAVAVGPRFVVAGDPSDNELGPTAGAAYVYERSDEPPATWAYTKVVSPDARAGQAFGDPVAIAQDTIAIASTSDFAGAVFVFERDPVDTWQHVAERATSPSSVPISLRTMRESSPAPPSSSSESRTEVGRSFRSWRLRTANSTTTSGTASRSKVR